MVQLYSRRNLSIISKIRNSVLGATKTTDISESVGTDSLPKLTGNGPFVELPKFEALGSPTSLLNVTLPASSRLNIRNGSIIAMNGAKLDTLTTRVKNLSHIRPLLYQEMLSVSPVSLLVSGGLNFTILDASEEKSWAIANVQNVVAWTGFNLELVPQARLLSGGNGIYSLSNFTGLRTEGKGKLVLRSQSDLFDVKLEAGEQLLLNPSNLVAHSFTKSEGGTFAKFTTLKSERLQFPPSFNWIERVTIRLRGVSNWIQNATKYVYIKLGGKPSSTKRVTKTGTSEVSKSIGQLTKFSSKFVNFISSQFTRLIRSEVYYQVEGPCELLISSGNGKSHSKTFTKSELDSIYETLK